MSEHSLWESLKTIAAESADRIMDISHYIFTHPELGEKEYESCHYLTKVLREAGFSVTCPYGTMETAFRAELRRGEGATIAFLAEYDALPGYGEEKRPAHACGHNWVAAASVGAALLLSRVEGWQGTVVVLGTPAEETVGGKVILAKNGAFLGIDAAFEMHLNKCNSLRPHAIAIDSWEFSFRGKASHAAAAPERGINALDAVNLTFAGISALRQQLKPDVRIHGIVTDGGAAVNVIPESAACRFYVRSEKREYLNEVSRRVIDCARGAALMTGAKLVVRQFENSYDDLEPNAVLMERMAVHLERAGFGEVETAKQEPGSTDLGTVSHLVPVFYGYAGVGDGCTDCHEADFIPLADSPQATEKAVKCALAMAYGAAELLTDQNLLSEVKAAFHGYGTSQQVCEAPAASRR